MTLSLDILTHFQSERFWYIALLLTAITILLRWLFHVRPWAGIKTRYPVVLVHGFLGFDSMKIGIKTAEYFRGIPIHLRNKGIEVHVYGGLMTSSIPKRAEKLSQFLDQIDSRKVNIIAHSMGGLDARYAISKLGCDKKVASLTTIGSPHRGTPIADLGDGVLGKLGMLRLLGPLREGLSALRSLTSAHLNEFNNVVTDAPKVYYASVVCRLDKKEKHTNKLLLPSYLQIKLLAGENDGLVPYDSQTWGYVIFTPTIDHWAQVGWSEHYPAQELYEIILHHIRKKGC